MTALAIHNHTIYKAETICSIRRAIKDPDLIIENPRDLNVAAMMSLPNCTIYCLVEKLISKNFARQNGLGCSNNSVFWFNELMRNAKEVGKTDSVEKTLLLSEKERSSSLQKPEQRDFYMTAENVNTESTEVKEKKKLQKIDRKKKIKKLVPENPRREGTWGHKSFSVIVDGMDVAAYLELGGRMQDLIWDIKKKFVELY